MMPTDGGERLITLDVGGTHSFTTSIVTLTSCSTYFEALVSERWTSSLNISSTSDMETKNHAHIFLDQDGEIFSILLSFMRYGGCIEDYISLCDDRNEKRHSIKSHRSLFIRVLRMADFLGVQTLTDQVKAEVCYNMIEARLLVPNDIMKVDSMEQPKENYMERDDLIQLFNVEIGSIENAIAVGLIPDLYFGYDKIVLDVSGHKYVTSRYSLMKHSDKFRDQLSWKNNEEAFVNKKKCGEIFLDADPVCFEILFQFIQNDNIDYSRFEGDNHSINSDNFLLRSVLGLADKLQMSTFLKFVKAKSYANLMTGRLPDDVDTLADLFDARYTDWETAFRNGALPQGLLTKDRR